MILFAVVRRFRFLAVPLLAVFALLLSCKTAPRYPDAVFEESAHIPLEAGALAYVLADVKAGRPILELIPIREMDGKQYSEMLDRTKSLAVALYPPESGRRFQLTAWGNYPSTRAGIAFGLSRGWKKLRSADGVPYWHSAENGLSVALNKGQAFAASRTDGGGPFAPLPGVGLPDGFGEFRRGAAVACWLENPGLIINRVFARMGIPLQIPADRIFISLFPVSGFGEDSQYQAFIRIETPSPSHVRSLAAILNLARDHRAAPSYNDAADDGEADGERNFSRILAAVLFANPPVPDGRNLNIKTAVLAKKELALLFKGFSLYSD